jgi:hypothetical protein
MNERIFFIFSEKWSPRWDDIDRGKPKNPEKKILRGEENKRA